MLTGCSTLNSNQSTALSSDEYAAILPYETSDTRVKHVGLVSDIDVRLQMEQGLMDLSKAHFSPSEVAYKTHAFLDFDTLDATDGSRGLLGTVRDANPNGLNPSSDEEFDTGNGTVTQAVILVDIYELDWYANDDLKGISLGLVVNDQLEQDGQEYQITEDRMKDYIEVTSSKLVNYMRERFNEISMSVPIYIAAYQLNHQDTQSLGGYVYEGYFEGNNASYASINEDWIQMPSNDLLTIDEDLADAFTTYKNEINSVLADYSYVVGQTKFENEEAVKCTIDVTTHGKTASEILAVIQVAKEQMKLFTNTDCEYLVRIINENEVYAMIQRKSGSDSVSVISMV